MEKVRGRSKVGNAREGSNKEKEKEKEKKKICGCVTPLPKMRKEKPRILLHIKS